MKKLLFMVLACMMVLGFTSTASAIVLIPNTGDTVISGTASPTGGYGTLLASVTLPYTVSGYIHGTLINSVYSSDGNGLLFTYEISRNTEATGYLVTRMTTTDFSGWAVDADYDSTTSGGYVPFTVDRDSPDVVGFNFGTSGGIAGVDSSGVVKKLWIKTDAHHYTHGTINLINGGTATLNGFSPTTPEPASMALLGLGLMGLCGSALRKRRMKKRFQA